MSPHLGLTLAIPFTARVSLGGWEHRGVGAWEGGSMGGWEHWGVGAW